MKRYLFKAVFLLGAVLSLGSCSEDYLNEPKPAGQVSEEVVFTSRAGVEAYISGILREGRGQFTTGHDAGGINSMYYARVVKGNDIIQGPTWFLFDYAHENREPTYRRTNFSWEYSYYMINQANTLINGVEASAALSDEEKADLGGQGRVIRAFYYFQLVMEFQQAYNFDPSLPAPPIYTELSLEGNPMSTVQEVYDLVISDLTTAIPGLSDARLDKSYVNKAVAQGILARVYQTTGNWSGAETNAKAAYGGNVMAALDASSYGTGQNDMANPEWIWGMSQYPDQTMYYFSAPHAQSDFSNPSYQGTYVNSNFVAQFSDTDVRKLFEVRNPDVEWQNYITTKFEFVDFGVDMPLMRTAEMILVEAEALYWQGQEGSAHDLLFALQSNRDAAAVKSSNSGPALLEEILLERRKELYAETGVEWFDAKRLERGINRDSNHRVVVDLEPNAKEFVLKVPQAEIDANPAIDASVNSNR